MATEIIILDTKKAHKTEIMGDQVNHRGFSNTDFTLADLGRLVNEGYEIISIDNGVYTLQRKSPNRKPGTLVNK